LFRKKVDPVTTAGFSSLISSLDTTKTREKDEPNYSSPPSRNNENSPLYIDDDDIVSLRSKAICCVTVPSEIIDLLTDVRDYLKTEFEPSIYVSDRRLVQAVNMLKVAAFTNGRLRISPFDCL
jgi:MoxR-like ATPase